MKKSLAVLVSTISLLAATFLPVSGAHAQTSSPLVTCINLITKSERISHNGQCRIAQEAQANWHSLTSDLPLPDKSKSAFITICSNKPSSSVTFQIIRPSCTVRQLRTDYFRSKALASAPQISKVSSIDANSAQIGLATDQSGNPDAPIAFYTITSSHGQSKNIYPGRDLNLTIDNLVELTAYSFTVTATTADGTSAGSVPSSSVTTAKHEVARSATPPAAQVSFPSTDTATVTIPAGVTNVSVASLTLGNPSLSFGSQGAALTAAIQSAVNPVSGGSTPFTVSGSTKIVDISVAGLSGTATVCLDGSPTAKLWHYQSGAWVDITTSHTSSQVCGLTSSFSPFASGEQIAAPAITLSSVAETQTVGSALIGYTIGTSTGGAVSSYSISPAISTTPGLSFDNSTGLISGTPTVAAIAQTYTVTGTNRTGSSAQNFTITVRPLSPCASGGPCSLGETGPGGGIIFYTSSVGFNCGSSWSSTGSPTGGRCHYLEVAPKNWSGSSPDPQRPGRVNATSTDISGIPNNYTSGSGHQTRDNDTADFDYTDTSQLGAGLLFTNLINSTDAGATAARLASSYSPISGIADYYLPTMTELNLLCQWSKGKVPVVDTQCGAGVVDPATGLNGDDPATGLNGYSDYWSSSDKFMHSSGNFVVWVLAIDLTHAKYGPSTESFGAGTSENWLVRPIRAF
jgi:hypothetical protein